MFCKGRFKKFRNLWKLFPFIWISGRVVYSMASKMHFFLNRAQAVVSLVICLELMPFACHLHRSLYACAVNINERRRFCECALILRSSVVSGFSRWEESLYLVIIEFLLSKFEGVTVAICFYLPEYWHFQRVPFPVGIFSTVVSSWFFDHFAILCVSYFYRF